MKIVIDGEELVLRQEEVEIAKQAVNRFMRVVKEGGIETNMPTLYITLLAVMQAKATDLLNTLNGKQIAKVLDLLKAPGPTA